MERPVDFDRLRKEKAGKSVMREEAPPAKGGAKKEKVIASAMAAGSAMEDRRKNTSALVLTFEKDLTGEKLKEERKILQFPLLYRRQRSVISRGRW